MSIGNIADYVSQTGGAADVASGVGGLSSLIPGIGELLGIGITLEELLSGNFGQLLDPFGIFGLEGVPKGAKTGGAAQSLQSSGDPLSADLGRFIQSASGGKDSNVLSNPAFAHETNSMADILTWLSGKALPGWKAMGSSGEIAGIKPPSGAPYSKDVNIMGVQSPEQMAGILGKSPNLTPEQINTIMPRLMELAKSPGSVGSMRGALDPLVTSAKMPGDIPAYMNQGGSKLDFPGLTPGGDINRGGGGGGRGGFNWEWLQMLPLLNLFNFSNQSDQPNQPNQPNPQQNILNAFMPPHGVAFGVNQGAFPR